MEKTLNELVNICDTVIDTLREALNNKESCVFLCCEFSKELNPEIDISIYNSRELLELIQKYFPLTRKACCQTQVFLEKCMEKSVSIP